MRRNNLKEYKRKQQEINSKLVQKAIEHIKKLGGNLSVNNVSRVTYEIANPSKGEKGLTPAAISKNQLYKTMILKAKAETNNYVQDDATLMTLGDLQIKLYQEKIKNKELSTKIKILEEQLSEISLIEKRNNEPKSLEQDCMDIREENKHLKSLLKGIISTLAKLEIIEMVDDDIKISLYDVVLLNKENLKYIKF